VVALALLLLAAVVLAQAELHQPEQPPAALHQDLLHPRGSSGMLMQSTPTGSNLQQQQQCRSLQRQIALVVTKCQTKLTRVVG
jgi:hypothetical protein